MPTCFWRMMFSFLAIVFLNCAYVSNAFAFLNGVDIEICEHDTWNDIEDSHHATINNICHIRLLDEATLKILIAKLEKLNLTEPVKTAVKGAIQGFKEGLQNDLKPLITELNTLLKESMDHTGQLITKVDDRVKKRIDQITQAIDDTVKRFEKSIISVIQQAETSIINITKQVEDSTKNTIKQTEESIVKVVDEMVSQLESTASKLNDELSLKFETIRQNIKTDIMFIGDYVSCKTSKVIGDFEQSLKNVVQTLPFSKSDQKPCQSCQPGFFSFPDERECACCRHVKLLDKNNQQLMTTDIKLFRYNVCRLKNELSGNSKIQDVLDNYMTIQQWAINVYCHSNTIKVGKYKPLIQIRMEEETEKAYEAYFFWDTVSQ